MTTTHDNALFINPEPGVHDGCYLLTERPSATTIAALNERLTNLGEPSSDYQLTHYLMAFVHPIQTEDEWKAMHADIEKRREKWLADHANIVEVDEGDFLHHTLDGFQLGMVQPVYTMTPETVEAIREEHIGQLTSVLTEFRAWTGE